MKKLLYITIGVIIGLAILAFAYWTISPLFITTHLDEAAPVAMNPVSNVAEVEKSLPVQEPSNGESVGAPVLEEGDTEEESPTLPLPETSEPEVVQPINFNTNPKILTGTPGHPVSGTVRVIDTGEEKFLRYENFSTINGPDIFVYLATDEEASEFVNLGKVKATEGNINYQIPADVDPTEYPYALVWCRAFSELFNSARLY